MLLSLWLALAGCTPTCEQSCNKLIDCGLGSAPNVTLTECKDACEAQQDLYDGWDDDPEDKAALLRAQRQCIGASTCDEIDAGACWDDALDPF